MQRLLGLFVIVGLAVMALATAPVPAAAVPMDFDFNGNFQYDNDVVQINFTVNTASPVTVFSSSWISGDPPMGFDPMLGIWTSAGELIEFQDDGSNIGSTMSNGVSYDHGTWDSYYQVDLQPGSYIATIVQFDNFNNTNQLADGFMNDGNPNFTFDYGFGGATQPYFNGVWDDNDPRSSYWEFHLLNVDQAAIPAVPEPSALVLLGAGVLGLIGVRRFRR